MSSLRQAQESPPMSPSQHQQQQQRNGSRSQRSIMDLRNLCQRLDVDSFKAKLPAMPQLKLPKSLPKSLPKLQAARRILRRRSAGAGAGAGGVGGNGVSRTGGAVAGVATGAVTVAAGIAAVPHAQFINRTPQRISTISSLMHEQGIAAAGAAAGGGGGQLQATYCSAGSLDDDYYAPYGGGGTARASRPISPIKMPPTQPATGGGAAAATLGATAANLSQRLQRGYKSLSELRLKHLFAKQTTVRRDNIEVQRYVEQYEAERRVEEQVQAQRDRQIADNYRIHISTLPISRQNTLHEQGEEEQEQREQPVKHTLAEHSGDESGLEQAPVTTVRSKKKKKPGIAATRFAKVRQPPLPMPMEEQQQQQQTQLEQDQEQQQKPATELPMRQAVRQNLKRLRKSIKRVSSQQPQQHDSDEDAAEDEVKVRSSAARGATLRARLRRFTSSEQLQQRWRKSFKGGTAEEQSTTAGGAGTAAGAGVGAALGLGMGAQLERTMAKLNEKMQQMKFFHGRSNSAPEQNKPNTVGREPNEIDDEELEATYHHSDSSEGDDSDDSGHEVRAEDAFEQDDELEVEDQHTVRRRLQASTAWSSESLEEDEHMTPQQQQQQQRLSSDYPRVLIHQQHSDAYESTLIIAVASTPSPELREETSNTAAWLPNEQIIAGFKQQQQLQQQQLQWPAPALYKAKSIDIFECEGGAAAAFADFDEALRNAPVLRISAGTTNTNSSGDDEEEEGDDSGSHATRIRLQLTPQIGNSCESLMEQQEPLEYDEDERQEESKSKRGESTDAERPPSVSPPPPPLPQRRPPAAPPSAAPPIYDQLPPPLPVSKPPPAMAPPALPIELAAASTAAAPAPAPTPASDPVPTSAAVAAPIPAPLPTLTRLTQRSASMTRPSKPLVKTSSLRLTYNEQVHPGDIGKVNKLITRFEGGRPRLCARRLTHSEELTTCSDAEDEPEAEQATPTNVQRIPHIVTTQPGNNNNNNNSSNNNNHNNNVEQVTQQQQLNLDRQNSNCSRSSEYGSPLSYPMRRSATPTRHIGAGTGTGTGRALAPLSVQQSRHSRRSMTRDDDNFYSFDSDEENSYYSISPSSSSRYVVEI